MPPDGRCPFCGAAQTLTFSAVAADTKPPQRLGIVECRRCAAAWQQPPWRTGGESLQYFREQYTTQEDTSYFDPIRRAAVARLQMDWIESLTPVRGTLLDVGAGDGALINEAATRGWTATGIEPAINVIGRRADGARYICGTLQDIPSAETFDVVTLLDVIEHVDDGLELLRMARSHVRGGGCAVVETGNYASSGRVEAGCTWWCYQRDHLWYYTPDSLLEILQRAGFSRFRFCHRVLRPRWKGVSRYSGPSYRTHIARALMNPFHIGSELRTCLSLRALARLEHSGLDIITVAAWC